MTYAQAAPHYSGFDNINFPLGREAQRFSFNMPAHDVWLYAVTEANKYYVDYHGHGETSWVMTGSEYTYDTEWELKPNAYVKEWYTFQEWNETEGGGWTGHADGAKVFNWTTEESGHVHIYAQWIANYYNIHYNLNDWSGSSRAQFGTKHPATWEYDKDVIINNPSRTWYTFSGWDITDMLGTHVIDGVTGTAATENEVMAEQFRNLRSDTGTVNFAARWSADEVLYTIKHFLQDLDGSYPANPIETNTGTYVADQYMTWKTNEYTWFDTPAETGQIINANGTTVFTYSYPRQSHKLTLIAGTWVETVTVDSTSYSSGGTNSGSDDYSFKFDDQVTLSFKLKNWYQTGTWSGYEDTSSSFKMPAEPITKEAYATAIVYQLKVNPRWGAGATDRTTYTVEDEDIPLGASLTRDHSTFLWWTGWVNGEGNNSPDKDEKVAHWSTGDREYSAVWSCVTWYHLENTGTTNEICEADTNTKYLVNHIQEDLNWNYTIYIETGYKYGTTNTQTPLTGRDDAWFELSGSLDSYKKNIEPDGSTVVNIYYNRLEYAWTINSKTWVTASSANGKNSGTSPFKYEDTVNLSATVEPGYTWVNWTVKDASGNTVTVTDTTPGDPDGATFQMPANSVTITPEVTRDNYTIEYELYSWTVGVANPTSYNVESEDIILNQASRPHSQFKWWTGWVIDWEQLSWTTQPVKIKKGSVWNRKYYAVYECDTWYTANPNGLSCDANNYSVTIDYDDEEHANETRDDFVYDQTGHIDNPSKTWYDFAWWTVSWADSTATVDGNSLVSPTSGTEFKNLTTTSGGNVTLTATWTPKTTTEYKVFHYTKNLGSGYTLANSGTFNWTSDAQLTVANLAKEFTGFGAGVGYTGWTESGPAWTSVTTVTIDRHGTTEIHIYYDRSMYHVYLSGDANVLSLSGAGDYRFWDTVNVSAVVKSWYHFKEWQKRWSGFVVSTPSTPEP